MAKSKSVWGIDIGQAALKALRCSKDENGAVVATSFDFIEYPKLLSQPDADPVELVQEALETFLERNNVKGDTIAISVSGQAGLSRFFRPPPVDAKTLQDIVKYEVKAQIPFPIEDVVWDWQRLGGSKNDDLIVDAEIGLFAIKRDSVFTSPRPFDKAGIEVDLVQLAPLAIFNVVCHDVLGEIPDPELIDPENPPESLVVLSLGTDSTDLIISNGIKLWLRNIPIGGNHFTKQLSREMKLTHAKAEHLKRNVRQMAENEDTAKRIFQAMRPVFNDLVTEIQRSLTFYNGMEKNAKIERVVLLGNAARLPGLRQFLTKQLELDIVKLNKFETLQGDVVSEKAFVDNMLAYAPCYGLCLQGLNSSLLKTNLLPQEIVKERLIRSKKPWVLSSVALIVAGLSLGYLFSTAAWWRVDERYAMADGTTWKSAFAEVAQKKQLSDELISKDQQQTTRLERLNKISLELADEEEKHATMAEFMSAIYQVMPKDSENSDGILDPLKRPFHERNEIYVNSIETQSRWDLAEWKKNAAKRFEYQFERFERLTASDEAKEQNAFSLMDHYTNLVGDSFLQTDGWVVEMLCHHYHNSRDQRMRSEHGIEFVRRTLLKNLIETTVLLPGEKRNADGSFVLEEFTLSDIGVYYPTVISDGEVHQLKIPNINVGRVREAGSNEDREDEAGDSSSSGTGDDDSTDVPDFAVDRYDFVVQMAWVPTNRSQRILNREARLKWQEQMVAALSGAGSGAGKKQSTPTRSSEPLRNDTTQNDSGDAVAGGPDSADEVPPADDADTAADAEQDAGTDGENEAAMDENVSDEDADEGSDVDSTEGDDGDSSNDEGENGDDTETDDDDAGGGGQT
ncbi:MAG TPA: type IV pilus assembly protein PilM [Pirellulaceae bacterium]|nr:type IV pilus assembly protein PilM [Pirellulaceae bacterium]